MSTKRVAELEGQLEQEQRDHAATRERLGEELTMRLAQVVSLAGELETAEEMLRQMRARRRGETSK